MVCKTLPLRSCDQPGFPAGPLVWTESIAGRCIGLNYVQRAHEVKMAIPDLPTVFMKPSTSLADPYPSPTVIPKFAQSQWCSSKGFDGACPIGPVLVSTKLIPDPSKLRVKGLKNGKVMQYCGTEYEYLIPFLSCKLANNSDLIFPVAKIVSFLSQGTTMLPGTIIFDRYTCRCW
ncbi:hypothetical protein EAF04_007810 [Stromatinia cepivora]|nr:hypothetical protein EAF04_007810 [Stromatinia cepivora]